MQGSKDGGASWFSGYRPIFQFAYWSDVACATGGRFWAVGMDQYGGDMIASTDADGVWQMNHRVTFPPLSAVTFVGSAVGWAVGSVGTIVRTANAGQSWDAQTSGTDKQLTGVDFVDGERGWAVGYDGTILATRDGGASWKAQKSGVTEHLTDVAFADAEHGWATGQDGLVLATTDGGEEWYRQYSAVGQDLFGIVVIDAEHAWLAGNCGSILKYDPTPPVAKVAATTLLRGRAGTIKVRLTNSSGGPDQVWATIAIYKGSKRVKRLETGWRAGNATVNLRYRPTLPPGIYTMKVDAVDRLGHQSERSTSARLTIR
jgi:hypothetical protein